MKLIAINGGQVTTVDDEDYDRLLPFKWRAAKHPFGFYVLRSVYLPGKQTCISMQREIMGLGLGDKRQVDHINHDTLDNQKSNLRIVTRSQNQMNRKKNRNSKSKYKGVSWVSSRNRWVAHIAINRKKKWLGSFSDEVEAYRAYCEAASELHGEFAHL